MSTKPLIQVVAGCVQNASGELFVAKRVHSPAGAWEMPGGKVEAGERHSAALRRELWEELKVNVDIGHYITTTPVLEDQRGIRFVVHLYEVQPPRFGPPEMDSKIHSDFAWMSLEQLQLLDEAAMTLSLPYFIAEIKARRERAREHSTQAGGGT
jgi:mutator protein MutT